ncbi:MAG TPA: thioredoxin family protein [Luteolibacter sp.]|nr:thioredoxin family protein [Luteolibacter sp.]
MISSLHNTVRRLCALALCLLPAACGNKGDPPKPSSGGFGGTGVPPQLAAARQAETPASPGNLPQQVELTPEEDIFFTDPDNPEGSLPELSTVLAAAPDRREPWERSETIARRLAAREGKPLLIWFTDSARSPMCKALAQELFNDPEFNDWATEKIVRLKVDSNVVVDDSDLSLGEKETLLVDRRNHVERMRKRYKVLGNPMLVMCGPDGKVLGRYRGYKRGQADYYWGLIRQGEVAASVSHKAWREGLEKKGYRDWHDRQGRKVFAKLVSYSEGNLILIEPDGTRCRTHERKLSDDDRDWIAEQKRMRGL